MQVVLMTALASVFEVPYPWTRQIASVKNINKTCDIHTKLYDYGHPSDTLFWQHIYTKMQTDDIWGQGPVYIDFYRNIIPNNASNYTVICLGHQLVDLPDVDVVQFVFDEQFDNYVCEYPTFTTASSSTITTTSVQSAPPPQYENISCDTSPTASTQLSSVNCLCAYTSFPSNFFGFGWMQGYSPLDSNIIPSCNTVCGQDNHCLFAYLSNTNFFEPTFIEDGNTILNNFKCGLDYKYPPATCDNVSDGLFLYVSNSYTEYSNTDDDMVTSRVCASLTVASTINLVPTCQWLPCSPHRYDEPDFFPPASVRESEGIGQLETVSIPMPPSIEATVRNRTLDALSDYFLCDCQTQNTNEYFNGKGFYVKINVTDKENYFVPSISTDLSYLFDEPTVVCDDTSGCNVSYVTFREMPREWGPLPDTHTDTHPFIHLGATITGPVGIRVVSSAGTHEYANKEAVDNDYYVRMPSRAQCFNKSQCSVVSTVVGSGSCVWSCLDMDVPTLFPENFSFYAPPRIRRYNYTSALECTNPVIPTARKLAYVNTAFLPFLFNIPSLKGNERFVPWRDGSITALQSVGRKDIEIVPEYGCGGVVEVSDTTSFMVAMTKSEYINSVGCDDPQFETVIDTITTNENIQLFPHIIGTTTDDPANTTSDLVFWLETVYTNKIFDLPVTPVVLKCNASTNITLSLGSTPTSSIQTSWQSCSRDVCTSRSHHYACSQIQSVNNCSTIPLCEPCTNSGSTTTTIVVPTITFPPTPSRTNNKMDDEVKVAVISFSVIGVLILCVLLVVAKILYNRQKSGVEEENSPLLPVLN